MAFAMLFGVLLIGELVISLATASTLPFPIPRSPSSSGKVCTITPLGSNQDDTPQILKAFEKCNNGGTVVFPEGKRFYIATRLNPAVSDVTVEWRGLWQVSNIAYWVNRDCSLGLTPEQFSDDLEYWRNNSYPISFQNHAAGFVLSGQRIRINGYGTGGINGSGNSWYTAEAGNTKPGRPMPFVFWNVSDVLVEHCETSPRILDNGKLELT
jgi:hypothetical protein